MVAVLLLAGAPASHAEQPSPGDAGDPATATAVPAAIAGALLRESYWRGWWGGETRMRARLLGHTFKAIVGPEAPWRSYCFPELKVFVSVRVIGQSPLADVINHTEQFAGCDEGEAGNNTVTLTFPKAVVDAVVAVRPVAECLAAIERSAGHGGRGALEIRVSKSHTYDARVAYALLPYRADHAPELLFFDDHGGLLQAVPMEEPAASVEDGRRVRATLLKLGAKVRVP